MKKILSILGTRPELTKFSPVFDAMEDQVENVILHTGQHYSYEMDQLFFQQLHLPEPDHNLEVGSGVPTLQLAKIIELTGTVLLEEEPDIVVVLGDTNSTLGGAIAAKSASCSLVHIEAGCRSFNRNMPEEINRIVVDAISDHLFAPDDIARGNLLKEGIPEERITVTGSTSLEAVRRNSSFVSDAPLPSLLDDLPETFILTTIHRAGNTDRKEVLSEIVHSLNVIAERIPIVFPMHPRTKKMLQTFGLSLDRNVIVTEPLGYLQFLRLLSCSQFIISDSGGIQEEAAALNVPCFIPRQQTEWGYLIEAGKNFLVGNTAESILSSILPYIEDPAKLANIRAIDVELDFNASDRIVEGLVRMK